MALDPMSWRSLMGQLMAPAIASIPRWNNPVPAALGSTQKQPLSCSAALWAVPTALGPGGAASLSPGLYHYSHGRLIARNDPWSNPKCGCFQIGRGLCLAWAFHLTPLPTKQGTGFPSAIARTVLPWHGVKSRKQLESKLHPGAPKRYRELAQQGWSLRNRASHPELGQSTVPPPRSPFLETGELIIDVSGTAVIGSLTPPTRGTTLRIWW